MIIITFWFFNWMPRANRWLQAGSHFNKSRWKVTNAINNTYMMLMKNILRRCNEKQAEAVFYLFFFPNFSGYVVHWNAYNIYCGCEFILRLAFILTYLLFGWICQPQLALYVHTSNCALNLWKAHTSMNERLKISNNRNNWDVFFLGKLQRDMHESEHFRKRNWI